MKEGDTTHFNFFYVGAGFVHASYHSYVKGDASHARVLTKTNVEQEMALKKSTTKNVIKTRAFVIFSGVL